MENKVTDLQPYLKTLTLLCADSCPIMTTIYEGLFNILFKEVVFAKNAEDALVIYKNQKIDLIITEQDFPNMLGIELIRSIREENKAIPIIFVSAFEKVDLLTEAIKLKVHNFVKKPFETTDMLEGIESATRQLLADKYLEEKKKQELTMLKSRLDYSDYQETLSFQKALKIIRNDFYYKHLDESEDSITIIDFLYSARDVISGDTYAARKIDEHRTLFTIMDGMGKGLSASITSMITVTYLNRLIDLCVSEERSFFFKNIIEMTIKYVSGILLENEILSVSFLLSDTRSKTLQYATFAMPPILLLNSNDEVVSVKSNNPPISCYTDTFEISKISYQDIKKLLAYSDGLVENTLINEEETYAKYIKDDFKHSMTREDLKQKIIKRLAKQEDDITFIMINYLDLEEKIYSKTINTSLENIEKTNEWFEEKISTLCKDDSSGVRISLAFNELLMNAYEHGNLGIKCNEKHKLIEADEYYECLLNEEARCKKKIDINIYLTPNSGTQKYLVVKIKDEGLGFDTDLLKNIFGLNKKFNQRGILMSRSSSLGIYYNDIGNQVTFISKV